MLKIAKSAFPQKIKNPCKTLILQGLKVRPTGIEPVTYGLEIRCTMSFFVDIIAHYF
jgi:hypothetical protein